VSESLVRQTDAGVAPAVSVVIPLFNKEDGIGRALASIRAQSRQDYEVVVVNDGSTDDGPRIVEAAAADDDRVRLHSQANAGVSAARNRGIAAARAGLVAFLDADDEWLPDYLETVLALRDGFPSCEVLATSYFLQPPGGPRRRAILRRAHERGDRFVFHDYFRVASRSDPPLWTSAVAASKRALEAVGGFPVGVRSGEDLLTWARLLVKYSCAYCADPKAIFNVGDSGGGRPTRMHPRDDEVGRELQALLTAARGPMRAGLRRYVAMWHKMRASVFLRGGLPLTGAREALRGLRFCPWAGRLYTYLVLAALPASVRRAAFRLGATR